MSNKEALIVLDKLNKNVSDIVLPSLGDGVVSLLTLLGDVSIGWLIPDSHYKLVRTVCVLCALGGGVMINDLWVTI